MTAATETQKVKEQLDNNYKPPRAEREKRATEDLREQIRKFNEVHQ